MISTTIVTPKLKLSTCKYPGVHVDSTVKWKTHIQELQKKLRKAGYSLYHLNYAAIITVLRQVESYIWHSIIAWGNSTHCKNLLQAQNRLLKILYKIQTNTNYDYNQTPNNNHLNTQYNNYSSNNNARYVNNVTSTVNMQPIEQNKIETTHNQSSPTNNNAQCKNLLRQLNILNVSSD